MESLAAFYTILMRLFNKQNKGKGLDNTEEAVIFIL